MLNFRASYVKEVENVTTIALAAGIKPTEVCAYVQNDSYGMSGLNGLRTALLNQASAAPIIPKLDQLLNLQGDHVERNNIGPVGVYERDTLNARNGYQSLKKWEETNKTHCRLVITAGVFEPIAQFIAYARSKNETWAFSMVSFTGTPLEYQALKEKGLSGKVVQTQVVPALDGTLPILVEARKELGQNLNFASLEGYIIGKWFLVIALAAEGPLSRESFLQAARRQSYDVGGLKIDLTNGKNPGSDFVLLTALKEGVGFLPVKPGELEALLKQ